MLGSWITLSPAAAPAVGKQAAETPAPETRSLEARNSAPSVRTPLELP